MAEEKEEKVEKRGGPVVEISIGFVVCILILIISTLLIVRLNGDKKILEDELAKTRTVLQETQERNNVLNNAIREITQNFDDLTNNQIKAKLNELVSAEAEVPSGDVVAPSGEVVE